jgi:hypothetical protein
MCHAPAGQWIAMNAVLQRGTSIALACRTFHPLMVCKKTTARH